MKKIFSLFLIFVSMAFVGCASAKTNVTIKIVVDEGDDGKFEQIIIDQKLELEGKGPSIDTIINQLKDNKTITPKYSENENGTTELIAINEFEVKEEQKDAENNVYTTYCWFASINNGDDVLGLWSNAKLKEGDTIIVRYAIRDIEPTSKK